MLPITEIEPSLDLRIKTTSPDAGVYPVKAEILTWWLTRTVWVSKGASRIHLIIFSVWNFSFSKCSKNEFSEVNSEASPRSNKLAVFKHLHHWLEYTIALSIPFDRNSQDRYIQAPERDGLRQGDFLTSTYSIDYLCIQHLRFQGAGQVWDR